MKHWLTRHAPTAARVAVIAVAGLGTISAAQAATVISAIVPFTKVDNGYSLLQDMYARFQEKHRNTTITSIISIMTPITPRCRPLQSPASYRAASHQSPAERKTPQ